jgi:hypothetical protein
VRSGRVENAGFVETPLETINSYQKGVAMFSSGRMAANGLKVLALTVALSSPAAAQTTPAAPGTPFTITSDRFVCTTTGYCVCTFLWESVSGSWNMITNVSFGGEMTSATTIKVPYLEFMDNNREPPVLRKMFLSNMRAEWYGTNFTSVAVSLNDQVLAMAADPPVRVGFTFAGLRPVNNSFACTISGQFRPNKQVP